MRRLDIFVLALVFDALVKTGGWVWTGISALFAYVTAACFYFVSKRT